MGRVKAFDETGKEVWIREEHQEHWEEEFIERLMNEEDLMDYYFGHWLRNKNKEILDTNAILKGEVAALQRTPEEKAEEELYIAKFVKDNL